MNLVFFLLRHSRRTVLFAVLAGAFSGFINVSLLLLVHRAVNPNGPWGRQLPPGQLLIWLFAGLCLAALVTRIGSQTLLLAVSRRSTARLSMQLSRRILDTPLLRLEELGPGRLLTMLNRDIPTIARGLKAIPTLCINAIMIVGCLAFLAWLSPLVFVSILGALTLNLLPQWLLGRHARKKVRQMHLTRDTLTRHYRGLVEGVKELKIHRQRRKAFLAGPLGSTTWALEKQDASIQFLMTLANSGSRFMLFVVIGFLVFVVPRWATIDPGTMHGYIIGLLFLTAPLLSFGASLPSVARAEAALRNVQSLRRSLPASEGNESDKESETPPSWSKLELLGVTHAYRREREGIAFTLGPIDLHLQPGEVVFLVGGNGSGKTTLAKLLVGLYHPEKGEIRLDGKAIEEADRDDYQQLFSVVFADVYLFGSLLGLGKGALDSQAQAYLSELHLDHEVKVTRSSLSTTNLSRGQRKRLALLTAYLEDRPIYVFDEWASDQDPLFKQVFYTQILPQLKARGKLVLVLTHDDHFYHLADRVLHLVEGKLRPENAALEEKGHPSVGVANDPHPGQVEAEGPVLP
jgi:putative ATP-binding cassette transporter